MKNMEIIEYNEYEKDIIFENLKELRFFLKKKYDLVIPNKSFQQKLIKTELLHISRISLKFLKSTEDGRKNKNIMSSNKEYCWKVYIINLCKKV